MTYKDKLRLIADASGRNDERIEAYISTGDKNLCSVFARGYESRAYVLIRHHKVPYDTALDNLAHGILHSAGILAAHYHMPTDEILDRLVYQLGVLASEELMTYESHD